jgi:serine/threonine-protein kinase
MLTTTWRTIIGPDGTPELPPPEDRPAPTSQWELPDRYLDLGHLAEGAVGEVRRVRDRKLGTELVMKLHRRGASPTQRRRFEREARLTARLHHPNIVPALDLGWMPNGTPWFTMPEVRGQTLGAVLKARREHADAHPLRRILEILSGVARALAYAHEEKVVHRDVKPENLMIGRFGDVRVMDFGVAMDLAGLDEVLDDAVVGTPLYMAPEQARGEIARCGPAIDVYALGVILYELLTNRTPYQGDGIQVWHQIIEGPPPDPGEITGEGTRPPSMLLELVRDAMRREPSDRPSALEVARRLDRWLDGDERRRRARELVVAAQPMKRTLDDLRDQVTQLRQRASTLLDALPMHAPVEEKEPGWGLQDEADRAALELRRQEARYVEKLRSALYQDPDCPEAHARLAAFHRRLLEDAERTNEAAEEAEQEELLRTHDRGEHAAFLEGLSAVTLVTEPAGAVVVAQRLVHRERRWQVADEHVLGRTPLVEAALPHGNWRLVIRADGRREVVYPVHLRRNEHADGIAPGDTAPTTLLLPADLHDDEVYVPAGWYTTGGDPDALDPLPTRRVWVDGFAIGRYHVTVGAYLAFLDALGEAALPWVPTTNGSVDPTPVLCWNGRRWTGEETAWMEGLTPDHPRTSVTPMAAHRYAEWFARHHRPGTRLPHQLEWAKAARGVDARGFPWGDQCDPSLAVLVQGQPGVPCLQPIGRVPTDSSVYGMRDAGGNARDIVASSYHEPVEERVVVGPVPGPTDLWIVRGGCWASTGNNARSANRLVVRGDESSTITGFRIARSVIAEPGARHTGVCTDASG